jgi:hypothetical protein
MVYRPLIQCIHRDNFNRCRVHKAPWWARWLLPKGRPLCVFAVDARPQDGEVTCAEQYVGHVPRAHGKPPPPPNPPPRAE